MIVLILIEIELNETGCGGDELYFCFGDTLCNST